MADQEDALPWDGKTTTAWCEVVESWTWRELGGGDWAKGGRCQRCGHPMTVKDEEYVESRMLESDALDALDAVEVHRIAEERTVLRKGGEGPAFYARCDCGEEHPGRPPELSNGCGRWGYVEGPPRDG